MLAVAQICMASTGGTAGKPRREIYLFSYTFRWSFVLLSTSANSSVFQFFNFNYFGKSLAFLLRAPGNVSPLYFTLAPWKSHRRRNANASAADRRQAGRRNDATVKLSGKVEAKSQSQRFSRSIFDGYEVSSTPQPAEGKQRRCPRHRILCNNPQLTVGNTRSTALKYLHMMWLRGERMAL